MTDAVIVDAIRTPIGALGGILASVRPDDMAALVIKEIVQRNQLDPALVPRSREQDRDFDRPVPEQRPRRHAPQQRQQGGPAQPGQPAPPALPAQLF